MSQDTSTLILYSKYSFQMLNFLSFFQRILTQGSQQVALQSQTLASENTEAFVHRLSSVRRPSSVRVAIFSEPNARISFKFWLLLPLSHTLGLFFEVLKNKIFIFLRVFFVFVNMLSHGSQDFKTLLLLQIAAESFQSFCQFSSQWSTQKYVWDL